MSNKLELCTTKLTLLSVLYRSKNTAANSFLHDYPSPQQEGICILSIFILCKKKILKS